MTVITHIPRCSHLPERRKFTVVEDSNPSTIRTEKRGLIRISFELVKIVLVAIAGILMLPVLLAAAVVVALIVPLFLIIFLEIK